MVVINFSGNEQRVWLSFPSQGSWVEQIDKNESSPQPTVNVSQDGEWHEISVLSYYGSVYALS